MQSNFAEEKVYFMWSLQWQSFASYATNHILYSLEAAYASIIEWEPLLPKPHTTTTNVKVTHEK